MFRQGDKVECIRDADWGDAFLLDDSKNSYDPKKGDVLTVLGTREFNSKLYLYFVEISVKGSDGDRECYNADTFRKLVPHDFKNAVTEQLANMPLIEEGIERIIVKPEYA
jgi:hypothetical protein